MTIYLGSQLPAASSNLPEPMRAAWGQKDQVLLGLAPDGVYLAVLVTKNTVGSYPTLSPLPFARRFTLCCTFRRITAPGCYPASCSMVPGLSSSFLAVIRYPIH